MGRERGCFWSAVAFHEVSRLPPLRLATPLHFEHLSPGTRTLPAPGGGPGRQAGRQAGEETAFSGAPWERRPVPASPAARCPRAPLGGAGSRRSSCWRCGPGPVPVPVPVPGPGVAELPRFWAVGLAPGRPALRPPAETPRGPRAPAPPRRAGASAGGRGL